MWFQVCMCVHAHANMWGTAPHHTTPQYFNFIPQYMTSVIPPDGAETAAAVVSWEGSCFSNNTATVSTLSNGSLAIAITSTPADASNECSDDYAFLTVTSWELVRVDSTTTTVLWDLPADMDDSEVWDLENKGVRVHRFLSSLEASLANLAVTLELFVPETTRAVGPHAAKVNLDFLSKYAKFDMAPLDSPVVLNESDIHSGDFFGIIRLDGLDPMLGWAMGSTTGHTTTAIWIDDELYVAESTVDDSYWPDNGVQMHKYSDWVQLATEAGFNAVHVPLSDEYRAKYDEGAARAFLMENLGTAYGYQTMLWSWLDTVSSHASMLPLHMFVLHEARHGTL